MKNSDEINRVRLWNGLEINAEIGWLIGNESVCELKDSMINIFEMLQTSLFVNFDRIRTNQKSLFANRE